MYVFELSPNNFENHVFGEEQIFINILKSQIFLRLVLELVQLIDAKDIDVAPPIIIWS